MLTLIKLIHTLNQSSGKVKANLESSTILKFQAICAVFALGWSGVGRTEAAQAGTVDRQDLAAKPIDDSSSKSDRSMGAQFFPPAVMPTPKIAQNASPNGNEVSPPPKGNVAPPPPPPSSDDRKLKNNLTAPATGAEVQISNTTSLTLKDALDIALQNNRDVQAARLAVTRDQGAIREAQAAQAVQVGATGTLQNQGTPVITGTRSQNVIGDSTDVSGNLRATYNVLDAGGNSGRVRAAEEQVKFDKLDLTRVEQQIKGNVFTAYYDLQQADSLTIINQAAVKDAERSLSDAQLQEKAGVGTKFDILRAEVQLATANQNLVNAQGQQITARKKIAQLLSVADNIEYKAADPVRELGAWGYKLEDSIVLAYKNRPELKQQLVRRNISEQQQYVASAADSAQVNLFANYNLSKSISTSFAAQDSYNLGAQVSWNFWDGGAAGARSYQQKVAQEISENQFTTSRNQVRFEVEQAYYSIGTSKKNIETSTKALKQAEESLKLARLRFQAGVGTQTDVIQAQTDLATARGNRITAILNYNRALASIRTATVTIE
jgi:outer membrane protein TolC